MTSYNFSKLITPDLLQQEIIAAGLTTIHHIDTVGTDVWICFTEPLSEGDETLLSTIVDSHSGIYSLQITIKNRILAAMEFGRDLMAEYGASNIISGLTMEQIQEIMERTIKVQAALSSGSLYVALTELALVQTDEIIITPERVTEFRNKIETYLNNPLT